MGVLYNSTKLQKNMKRDMVIGRLEDLGVTTNEAGTSIHELDYNELKRIFVLAEMRQVDIDHPDHKWFR